MITLFKIILFFILLSYAVRLLSPLILSFFIKRFQNKMKNKFDNINNMNFEKQTNKKNSKPKEKVGEYVDFEEID
jgi:Na+-transporting methylmalonyl-CoA/oxaloacetate decarboxylase gamma subunit